MSGQTPATPTPAPPAIDTSFLPLTSGQDDVPFPLVDDGAGHGDQEATLEALRAAFSESHDNTVAADAAQAVPATLHSSGVGVPSESDLPPPTLVPASQVQVQSIDKAVSQLQQLSAANQSIVDQMDAPRILQGLMASYRLLYEGHRRQTELVKNIIASIEGRGPPTIDPAFAISYVPRSEYDSLKARYDALVSTSSLPSGSGSSRRTRVLKSVTLDDGDHDRLRDGGSATPFVDDEKRLGGGGRKRRSMKLEHLVHKMANRRLGVEYPVSAFESKGTRDLPDPASIPAMAAESVNAVDEFRPDFRADVSSNTVRPFLDTVITDCKTTWNESYAADEPEVDEDQIVKSVHTYWTRLGKRYDEQLTRERGEVHKDEITRRKQNQYRRQQSLVARRTAAFDSSPLNLCKLRALYRTLLTIDFASMTNERPDLKREYTEDEWNAYRKLQCGTRSADAHEVVDQFWLSANARSLLNILDVYSLDQATKMRRKGRPKQPAPTFHMPSELWDRSNLPLLRPKDAQGLPVSGAGGIILFKFHIDEKVQQDYPDWAQGLYDNPPVPEEDRLLPNLTDVMSANAFYHLKPRVRQSRDAAIIVRLSPEEVQDVLTRPDTDQTPIGTGTLDESVVAASVAAAASGGDPDASFDLSTADFMSARGLESIVALASSQLVNPFATPAHPTGVPASAHFPPNLQATHAALMPYGVDVSPATTAGGTIHGPSPGSSVRARRQAKRMMSEVPGGAATPVAKKRRPAGEPEPEVDLSGDASFLDSL